ncbi:MAG TPA: lysophospholipid acyltransferase family protein, partial [Nitrospirota bacterium]
GVVRILPYRTALRLGGFLGELAFVIDKRHQRLALNNIKESFKDFTDEQAEELARASFRNVGYTAFEFVQSWKFNKKFITDRVKFKNRQILDDAYAKNMGVVVLTGHIGNWEFLALNESIIGKPNGVVARPLDNPYLDKAVAKMRCRFGNIIINKNRGMRGIFRALDDGKAVGVLLDQNVRKNEGVFVDFFGRPACTNKGLALIAIKTKAPIIPAFIHRTGLDTHELVIGDPMPLVDTGDREADVLANTIAYTKTIEDFVRQYPDQWFWMHNRWKTKPEEA